MSRTEIILLYETEEERKGLEPARSILGQMGISYREEELPSPPTLSALQRLVSELEGSVCIWAAGRSAYLLPILSSTLMANYPFIIVPCPGEEISAKYLETVFEAVKGYPVSFTRPWDGQGATLLAVHVLAARHPSYTDLLNAFLQKKHLSST
ncbi:MAG: AIR carboxylase family protein [Bacteroidia bacterium]|nr:AIR carboxylase family protein [Bacteroidia bacterium]MDW8236688.1 AIR carboxylase family protein [Bacteroidia bacterium]